MSLRSQRQPGREMKRAAWLLECVHMVARKGALADIFPQRLAGVLGIPGPCSEQFHINSTRGPRQAPSLRFSRPPIVALAVPLLILMAARGKRAGPDAKRCSAVSRVLLFHRVPT